MLYCNLPCTVICLCDEILHVINFETFCIFLYCLFMPRNCKVSLGLGINVINELSFARARGGDPFCVLHFQVDL